jgi:hypothetical protein
MKPCQNSSVRALVCLNCRIEHDHRVALDPTAQGLEASSPSRTWRVSLSCFKSLASNRYLYQPRPPTTSSIVPLSVHKIESSLSTSANNASRSRLLQLCRLRIRNPRSQCRLRLRPQDPTAPVVCREGFSHLAETSTLSGAVSHNHRIYWVTMIRSRIRLQDPRVASRSHGTSTAKPRRYYRAVRSSKNQRRRIKTEPLSPPNRFQNPHLPQSTRPRSLANTSH